MISEPGSIQQERPPTRRNWPHLVKWIILIFLLLLLFFEIWSGEFGRIREMQGPAWLIFVLKLLLIALVIWLMRLQRTLFCQVTDPSGCAQTEYDSGLDKLIIVVKGTASGTVFASYTLSVERFGAVQPIPVTYPGGGTSGVIAVNNGELGRLDVSMVEPGSGFKVILTVSSTSSFTKTCDSTFDIQDRVLYIDQVGDVPARVVGAHPADPTEPLKLVKDDPGPVTPSEPEISVGGHISVEGGADLFCCGRQMVEYGLEYRAVAFGSDPWQADAAGAWDNVMTPLPYGVSDPSHPRRYLGFFGTLLPNFVFNGELTRRWTTTPIFQHFDLGPPLTAVYADRRVTVEKDWVTNPDPGALNGYFTVRLRLKHDLIVGPPAPGELYDAATVWIDNRGILVRITGLAISGGADLDACARLQLSGFVVGNAKTDVEIKGRAWDPIILDSYPANRPNDNFHSYSLNFKKDGGAVWVPIAIPDPTTPVPADRQTTLPAPPGDVGVLSSWDIVGALDAGPKPAGSPPPPAPYPKIYRGDSCAYLIKLYARDSTRLSDTHEPHDDDFYWPFCVLNDLPKELKFPLP